jgi:YVTN family beta-propeller protein
MDCESPRRLRQQGGGRWQFSADPGSITNDGTYVYTADVGALTVTKLDAATGVVVATFPVGFAPSGIAFDGTHLWVGAEGSGVRKMVRDTGEILVSSGTNITGCCGSITGLMVEGGYLWAAANSGGRVVKFNLADGSVADQVTTDVSGPIGVKIAGGHLWVTIGSQSKLLRF